MVISARFPLISSLQRQGIPRFPQFGELGDKPLDEKYKHPYFLDYALRELETEDDGPSDVPNSVQIFLGYVRYPKAWWEMIPQLVCEGQAHMQEVMENLVKPLMDWFPPMAQMALSGMAATLDRLVAQNRPVLNKLSQGEPLSFEEEKKASELADVFASSMTELLEPAQANSLGVSAALQAISEKIAMKNAVQRVETVLQEGKSLEELETHREWLPRFAAKRRRGAAIREGEQAQEALARVNDFWAGNTSRETFLTTLATMQAWEEEAQTAFSEQHEASITEKVQAVFEKLDIEIVLDDSEPVSGEPPRREQNRLSGLPQGQIRIPKNYIIEDN